MGTRVSKNKIRIIAIMLLCTPLLAISSEKSTPNSRIEEAKASIKATLKDPFSAQFQNIVIVKNSLGQTAVCGEYNARNSYGGYVGFERFGVSSGVSTATEIPELERMGCFGSVSETNRRQQDAQNALAESFRTEAKFNCNVILTLLENHFRNGETMESALNVAMTSTVNHARENGREIPTPVLQMVKNEYESALVKTSSNKDQVESIRHGDQSFKSEFTTRCTMQAAQSLEAQAKSLKP